MLLFLHVTVQALVRALSLPCSIVPVSWLVSLTAGMGRDLCPWGKWQVESCACSLGVRSFTHFCSTESLNVVNFVFIKMSSCNSGQQDWKIVKFCSDGVVWKNWRSCFCVQVMQNIKLWLLWNCFAGNTFSRQLLHFLSCFCHFVKICKLQLQPFEGKKLSAEVYWVWKVWLIFRNAKLKLAQHEDRAGF